MWEEGWGVWVVDWVEGGDLGIRDEKGEGRGDGEGGG